MNRKYVWHYADYAVGENEALYTAQAAQGWRLDKRGASLSRLRRAEPAQICYRIELASPAWMDDEELPEEQVALYEDCGWTLAARHGLVNVFSAPAETAPTELYSDPQQQAQTLKALRRQNNLFWLPVVVVVLLNLLMAAALSGSIGGVLYDLGADFRLAWIDETAIVLFYAALMAWGFYCGIVGAVSTSRLYRRLRRGLPLDHAPKSGQKLLRGVRALLALACVIFLVLSVAQWAGKQTESLPETADGPYLLLEHLGESGTRTSLFYSDRESKVAVSRSLRATHWDVFECMDTANDSIWMYQDVYRLRNADDAELLADALMDNATFARSRADFTRISADGLDDVWICDGEIVAIRGNLVAIFTFMPWSSEETQQDAILRVLADRWNAA
jgi:hypothetical protein